MVANLTPPVFLRQIIVIAPPLPPQAGGGVGGEVQVCPLRRSSKFFPGGVIAYTGGIKQKVLGVPDELYETKGSVSPEMAIAMARGVRDLVGTDYAISVTGVAGPTGGRSDLPIGTFYIGIAGPGGLEEAERIHTDAGDRDGNKRQSAQATLDLLGKHLKAAS